MSSSNEFPKNGKKNPKSGSASVTWVQDPSHLGAIVDVSEAQKSEAELELDTDLEGLLEPEITPPADDTDLERLAGKMKEEEARQIGELQAQAAKGALEGSKLGSRKKKQAEKLADQIAEDLAIEAENQRLQAEADAVPLLPPGLDAT